MAKYLTNSSLLEEIHKAKMTYCIYDDEKYTSFDAIIQDRAEITPELIAETKDKICAKRNKGVISRNLKVKKSESHLKEIVVEPKDIKTTDLIFRLMTFEHIPKRPKGTYVEETALKYENRAYEKVPFPPFKHIMLQDTTDLTSYKTVLTSHWNQKRFDPYSGRIHNELGKMWMLLVERIGRKGNFRNYTYLEDMKGEALIQLANVGLRFDESRQAVPNPFAFYTTVVNNAFKRILNKEKAVRDLRDDILEVVGNNPSMRRQLENEMKAQSSTSSSKA